MKKIIYDDIKINEGVDEYIEGINSLKDVENSGQIFLYSRTKSSNISSIIKTGESREFQGSIGAHALGYGLYTTLTLSGEQSGMTCYGNTILKHWIPGFDRCLVPKGCYSDCIEGDLCEYAHHGLDLYQQIDKFIPDRKDAEYMKHFIYNGQNIQFPSDDPKVETIFAHYGIDGYCVNRLNWCVWKDYKRLVPYMYSSDNGMSWKPLATQDTINVTVKQMEPQRAFGKDINNIYIPSTNIIRPSNGYFIAKYKNQDGRYNIISAKDRKKMSPIYFDSASEVDANGFSEVNINGTDYMLDVANGYLYSLDTDDLDFDISIENYADTLENMAKTYGVNETHSVFGSLLTEAVDEYVDIIPRENVNFNNKNDMYFFYRLAFPNQIDSISRTGFSKEFRGYGKDNTDWVGSGTYGCVYPQSEPSHHYGSVCICYGAPKKAIENHYLSPDPELAAKFNIKGTWAEQLQRFFPDLWPKWERRGIIHDICSHAGRTGSQVIVNLLYKCFSGQGGKSDRYLIAHDVGGWIYHGKNDGDSILTLDDKSIIPLSYRDVAKHEREWHPIELTDDLWNSTFNGWDPLMVLNGQFEEYGKDLGSENDNRQWIINNYRVKNGFMKVGRKADRRENFAIPQYGKLEFVSPIWFDSASEINNEGFSEVTIGQDAYMFNVAKGELYLEDDELEFNMEIESPTCTVNDLPNMYKS